MWLNHANSSLLAAIKNPYLTKHIACLALLVLVRVMIYPLSCLPSQSHFPMMVLPFAGGPRTLRPPQRQKSKQFTSAGQFFSGKP